MKKLILLSTLVFTLNAHAVNWIKYSTDSEDVVHEFDADSITHHDNNGLVLVVWAKFNDTETRFSVHRYELHCPSKMWRQTYMNMFLKKTGDKIRSEDTSDSPFQYAVPDTVIMDLIDYTCSHYR